MKSRTKKIIAFLCAVMMFTTTLYSRLSLSDVIATDSGIDEVTPVTLPGFTTISTDDFVDGDGKTMKSKEYTSTASFNLKDLDSFDKTLLSLKLKYAGTGTRIEFAGESMTSAFILAPNDAGTTLVLNQSDWTESGKMAADPYETLSATTAGVTAFRNDEMLLQISFEYGDFEGNDGADDMKLGFYFNGEVYKFEKENVTQDYVIIKNCNFDNFGDRLTVYSEGNPIRVSCVETVEEELNYVELDGYQTISVKDFVDSQGNIMKSQRYIEGSNYHLKNLTSFDKTLLTLKVTFEEVGTNTRIEFWGKDHSAYFYISPQAVSQLYTGQVGSMTAGDAYWSLKIADTDIQSTVNEEYILQISTLYKDYDGDGINDGVQMGLYLNGVRVNQVDLKDCNLDNFGNQMTIRCDGAPVKVLHVDTEEEVEPAIRLDGFRYVTLDAFMDSNGNPMESKTYTGYESFTMREMESFDRTLLTMKVKFEKTGTDGRIELLGIDEKAFFFIYPQNTNTLRFHPNAENTMTNMGDPWWGLELSNLPEGTVSSTINEEYILQISTEYKTDNIVQVGVYVNGEFLETYEFDSCNMDKFGNCFSIRCSEASPITVSAVGTTDELEFTLLDGFQNVSVYDFVDSEGNPMESKVYTGNETFTLKGRENFDKTLLTLKVKFEVADVNSRIEFWGIDESAFYFVYPSSTSQLLLAPNNLNTMNAMEDPYFSLRLSNLQHKEVLSAINEEYILQISTEYKANNVVQVNVYLNGSLVRTCDIDSCNMDKWGNRLTIRCSESSPITISVVETEGNAHYDEQIDVRDLVATIKAGNGLKMKSERAKLEADANGSGTTDKEDADIVRDRLLRTLPVADKDVMPIAGYYGPYVTYDDSGLYEFEDRINEHYFKLIADAGINLINYSDLNYASQWYLTQKTLNLCDKYQIGYRVKDSSVLKYANGSVLSDTDISAISAQIEKYSNNRAFYGMFLVDEPWTPYYFPVHNDITINGIQQYANLADVLTNRLHIKYSQSPLSIWAIHHPTDQVDVRASYKQYLDEYCKELHPEYLTWAYYPYEAEEIDGLPGYFYNLSIMRGYAEKKNIPLWNNIQAGGQFNDARAWLESKPYFPTEAQFNWNVNTGLAFGAKGISYFPIVQPEHFAYALAKGEPYETMSAATAGVTSFQNKEMLLQISFEYGDHDSDGEEDDVKMGFYFNGEVYKFKNGTQDYVIIKNCNFDNFGDGLTIYSEGKPISVSGIGTEDDEEPTQVVLEGFTPITTSDFVDGDGKAMESKDYTTTASFNLKDLDSFDKTLLSLKLKYAEKGTRIEFAGKSMSSAFTLAPDAPDATGTTLVLNQIDWTMDFAKNGLISATGERTQWWYYARSMNQYIATIDEILMNAENKGIIINAATEGTRLVEGSEIAVYSIHDDMKLMDNSYIIAKGADTKYSVADRGFLGKHETSTTNSWTNSDNLADVKLKDVTGETMIGCFDYNGKTALYVVNYNMDETSGPQTITLTFDNEYDIKIFRKDNTYNEMTSKELPLSMDPGEGVLLILE